jgi:Na+-driven multidrug efflux pump
MFFNELLWSSGMTLLNQCMSLRGLEVVSAINISSVVMNLFMTAYMAMGTSISILVGQLLGAGELERAVDEDRKLTVLSVAMTLVVAVVMILAAPYFPLIYNTTDAVRGLSTSFIIVTAIYLPMEAALSAFYFTMRCGGKTLVTFLFDSFFVWVCSVPLAYCLAHFTALPIIPIYAIVYGANVIKLIVGFILVKRRAWVNNLVEE